MKQKKVRILCAALCVAAVAVLTAGCGGGNKTYKDGTYEGKSEVYINEDEESTEGNGYGVVNITIKDGKISDCVYKTYQEDGTLKDSEYGKAQGSIANKDFYNKAQKAVAAADEYATMLIANGSLDGIDAISGATINYNEFVEAVNAALKQAEE